MNIKLKTGSKLAGEPEMDAKTAVLEAAPESERWHPLPGPTGHKAFVTASVDEDDGGRSANQQHIDEGIVRAEFKLMLQANRARQKNS